MKREEKEEKITDLNFPETKINNILKISIYYKKNVCGHLFLCKELKSLMFWVVEGKGPLQYEKSQLLSLYTGFI